MVTFGAEQVFREQLLCEYHLVRGLSDVGVVSDPLELTIEWESQDGWKKMRQRAL